MKLMGSVENIPCKPACFVLTFQQKVRSFAPAKSYGQESNTLQRRQRLQKGTS